MLINYILIIYGYVIPLYVYQILTYKDDSRTESGKTTQSEVMGYCQILCTENRQINPLITHHNVED